jgi:citrate lyase alpha subunit
MSDEEREPSGRDSRVASSNPPRHTRRLSDKILIAFHHACDQGDFEVAEELLRILEMMLTRRPVAPDVNRRKNMESLVAAHERLWLLRHPEANES